MAINDNQVVSIEYEVKLTENNEIVDSNMGGEPLTFIVGKGQIIPGLENYVKTMDLGDKGDVLVNASDAYGDYDNSALQTLPKEQFTGIELQEGMSLYGQGEDGSTVQVTVKNFNDSDVTIDFNHPLAGKDLMFTVAVSMVRDASNDEILSGVPAENEVHSSCGSHGDSCGCH